MEADECGCRLCVELASKAASSRTSTPYSETLCYVPSRTKTCPHLFATPGLESQREPDVRHASILKTSTFPKKQISRSGPLRLLRHFARGRRGRSVPVR